MLVGSSSNEGVKSNIPVSEQMLLLKYALYIIKSSEQFKNCDVNVNFLSADENSQCVRLLDDTMKTSEFVDGSYDAKISFMFISRIMNVTNNPNTRIECIDGINSLGIYLGSLVDFFDLGDDTSSNGVLSFTKWYSQEFKSEYVGGISVSSFEQTTQAGLVYRDKNGIEDNGATFVLEYSKN